MIIDVSMARADWSARVSIQAEQMLIVASAISDDEMREELLDYAVRLEAHAAWIANAAQ